MLHQPKYFKGMKEVHENGEKSLKKGVIEDWFEISYLTDIELVL